MSVSGAGTLKSTVSIGGATIIQSTLSVGANTLFSDHVMVGANITVSGNIIVNRTISVANVYSDYLTAANSTVEGTLSVSKSIVQSTLSVAGQFTIANTIVIHNRISVSDKFIGSEISASSNVTSFGRMYISNRENLLTSLAGGDNTNMIVITPDNDISHGGIHSFGKFNSGNGRGTTDNYGDSAGEAGDNAVIITGSSSWDIRQVVSGITSYALLANGSVQSWLRSVGKWRICCIQCASLCNSSENCSD